MRPFPAVHERRCREAMAKSPEPILESGPVLVAREKKENRERLLKFSGRSEAIPFFTSASAIYWIDV